MRTRDEELESKIEKLSNSRREVETEDKPSFFEKIRTQGSLLKSSVPPAQTIIPK